MRFTLGWFLGLGLCIGVVPAAEPVLQGTVVVHGDGTARTNVLVKAIRRNPVDGASVQSVALKNAKTGEQLVGQLLPVGLGEASTRGINKDQWLCFVVPKINAGETLTYEASFSPAPPAPPTFSWKAGPGQNATLERAGQPVLQYIAPKLDETSATTKEDTFKVYHHVYDPIDGKLITKGTGGQFTHHRGLFFGFNKISYGSTNCDIWHGTKDKYKSMSAYQDHEKQLEQIAGPVAARQLVQIGWHGPDKATFITETRELTTYAVPGGTLIDFVSSLSSNVEEPVKLDGDPQHAGFHFRAADEVSSKTKAETYYLRTDGKGKPGETRNWEPKTKKGPVNLPWNALSFVLGGQRYTALYLDNPNNPKEARYSERDYGRFGSYFEATVTKSRPLVVHYRVWVQRGELTVEQADAMDKVYLAPLKAELTLGK